MPKTIEIPDNCVAILITESNRHTKVFVGGEQVPLIQSIKFEAHASEVAPKLDIAFADIFTSKGIFFMPENMERTADEVREALKDFKNNILKAVPQADVTYQQAQIVEEGKGIQVALEENDPPAAED